MGSIILKAARIESSPMKNAKIISAVIILKEGTEVLAFLSSTRITIIEKINPIYMPVHLEHTGIYMLPSKKLNRGFW